jgi:hypothetical protein
MSHFAKNSSTIIMGFNKTKTIISLCFGCKRFFVRHARIPLIILMVAIVISLVVSMPIHVGGHYTLVV